MVKGHSIENVIHKIMSASGRSPQDTAGMLSRDLGRGVMNYFHRDDVTELFANPTHEYLWVDCSDGQVQTDVRLDKPSVEAFLRRAADFNGSRITEGSPRVECALPDPVFSGSRLTGVLPPVVPAPSFCLRKFSDEIIPLESYLADNILSENQVQEIERALHEEKSIGVVGGTGSGKTTLAMTLIDRIVQINPHERLITMEDTAELQVPRSGNWIPLFTHGNAGYQTLIEMSLRLSPDRIIVGECRGPALVSLFEAFISGHPGGVFTYHAHTVSKTLERFLINCRRDSDTHAHRYTIGQAVDYIIILDASQDTRYAPQMVRVEGYSEKDGYQLERIQRDPADPLPIDAYWEPPKVRSEQPAGSPT